ncbi:MAG: hypothetical protein OXO50_10070, partial [Caldilineaceae bacterium]|nr:hypothetical protein [Caldilineaceae bacterium]
HPSIVAILTESIKRQRDLVVARRIRVAEQPDAEARFVSLSRRPQGFAHASTLARGAHGGNQVRRIQDGPYGGTPLMIGGELAGKMVATPPVRSGAGWGAVRLSDYSVAQAAYSLSESTLSLPGCASSVELKVALLDDVGNLGTYDLDITGPAPRGPFDKIAQSPTSTYPSLWNHNAKEETRMVCMPDSQLQVKQGMEAKAATVWATASRGHLNRDFTFGSQALAVAFTDRESIGGRVWPNVIFFDNKYDYAFAVWGNSTLGL